MIIKLTEVSLRAQKEFELIKITETVKQVVAESGVQNGIVHVITEHTTTGITVNEGLSCVETDLMGQLDRLFPEDGIYHHNHYLPSYGTIGGNTPGHLKSMVVGNHCAYPIVNGQIKLGGVTEIYFAEFDGIKDRKYMIHVMGE